MVKRIVIEVSGINSKLGLLGCGGKKHDADAKKPYQERWRLLSEVGKKERFANEDQGRKVTKNGDQEISSDE
jgi:hypothetical protein